MPWIEGEHYGPAGYGSNCHRDNVSEVEGAPPDDRAGVPDTNGGWNPCAVDVSPPEPDVETVLLAIAAASQCIDQDAAPPDLRPAGAGDEEASLELSVREDERRRIARDLHDSVAQHLTGMNLGLSHIRHLIDDPQVCAALDGLSRTLANLHRDLRGLSYVLHPPEVGKLGLDESVRLLCEGVSRRSELAISLRLPGPPIGDEIVRTAVYRVLQEALFNVLAHAQARHVIVRIKHFGPMITLLVADDGIGIGKARGSSGDHPERHGVGLASMGATVAQFRGRLIVRDRWRHSGTFVVAQFNTAMEGGALDGGGVALDSRPVRNRAA